MKINTNGKNETEMNQTEQLIQVLESTINTCKSNKFELTDYSYTVSNDIRDEFPNSFEVKPRLVGKSLELTINWRVK